MNKLIYTSQDNKLCDQVCKNQPSSRTKNRLVFSNISYHNLLSIYTNKLNVLPQMQNVMGDLLKFTEQNIPYGTEDIREYLTRCNLRSHS